MSEDAASGEIRQLDPTTVERIAAGEVVERPASVVKELVENSLDADASRVEVAVGAGGKERIRVTDDGVGMSRSQVRTAVEEHTTSKIRDVSDLEAGVGTLGFRGEALHAIGAVSRLAIRTRPRGGDSGTELRLEGGEVTAVEPAGCPEGTTVEVTDLFFNVPARRKYLKQDGTEFAHVNDVATSYALANPGVRVSLEHDGRETFATAGQGDLRSTVMAVYGREVAEAMIGVGVEDLPDGPLEGVSGLVSHPETSRSSRDYLTTYVNGRYVTSGTIRDAVLEAYGAQLAADRYPFAVLVLELPGDAVDVNVHPRKTEIRLVDPEGVREQVRAAVEGALSREGLLRSGAPRGRSAPDEAPVDPGRGESADADPAGRTDASEPSGEGETASEAADDTSGRPADEPEARPWRSVGPDDVRADATASTPGSGPGDGTDRDRSGGDRSERESPSGAGAGARSRSGDGRPGAVGSGTPDAAESDAGPADPDAGSSPASRTDPHRRIGRRTEQARLGGDRAPAGENEAFEQLPRMRVLGQIRDTYVVAETDAGLVLVDQHAADERVNYERLREEFAGETTAQALAEPVELTLTAREAALFEGYADALARLGFHADRVDGPAGDADDGGTGGSGGAGGERLVAVRTVPSLIAEAAGPELIRDVLSALVSGEAAAAETVEAAADDLLADLACYPSITGNTSLTEGSVLSLLRALDDCENPWACPHGRPVLVGIDAEEIEARFERDYPGHG